LIAGRVREVLEAAVSPEEAEEWRNLRRGWCFGSESFRDRLMDRITGVVSGRKRASYRHEGMRRHDESEAGALLLRCLERLKLSAEALACLKQSDPRKQAVAWLIKTRTIAGDEWIMEHMSMGHRSNVGRAVRAFQSPSDSQRRRLRKHLLICAD
jgi:hypothetical protein